MSTRTTRDKAVLAALESLLAARTRRDEAPGLYFMYRDGGGYRVSADSLVPSFMWDERPPLTLAVFAASLDCAPAWALAALAPEGFAGAVFRFETWSVAIQGDPALDAHAVAMHKARDLSRHPDRMESRMAWAVTRDGAHYQALQRRGAPRIESARTDEREGLVPESLERIVRALTAGAN